MTEIERWFFFAVEVKKEPEPPAEVVKQEEREPAPKPSAPAPSSKPPPEKRARLQWLSSLVTHHEGTDEGPYQTGLWQTLFLIMIDKWKESFISQTNGY